LAVAFPTQDVVAVTMTQSSGIRYWNFFHSRCNGFSPEISLLEQSRGISPTT